MCDRRKKAAALHRVSFGTATCLAALLTAAVSGLGSQGAGFPSRGPGVDIRRAFAAPPPGYGEVPFWWWTGERLDKERLLWQLEELHKAGVSGTQINYAHTRSDGWKTEAVEPPIFSEAWWDVFAFMAKESAKRGMGIGLSGYTLDWPGRDNLFRRLGITGDDLRASVLSAAPRDVAGGSVPAGSGAAAVSVTAFALKDGRIAPGAAHALDPKAAQWELPQGAWRIVTVTAAPRPETLDPLNPESGRRVIERFFDPFLAHTPPEAHKALNYFFQDELRLAGDGRLWSAEFAVQFETRKGYDVRPKLAALFMDIGPETAKVRLDFNDVMVSLTEAYYFKPIFDWHNSRGMIYACDPASRGKDPLEFGDYFRAMRWYTAPGFDTPGSSADLIKNKVGSSIAHLYQRPRVWIEGYHSLGWQASTATIFESSNRNFLYGSTLLNLHGLYYTTQGGWWEWAPPCYHFRMPYWAHMPVFLKYFERLSYLLSQGVHVADVAIVNPHEPLVTDPERGKASQQLAYALGTELVNACQTDFDFIDADSLARAEVKDGRLRVAGESYRTLVLPGMFAIRHASLEKALAFRQAGGNVVALSDLPAATDRAGADDPQTAALVKALFAPGGSALHWTPPAAQPAPARTYARHFTGRWAWTRKPAAQASFKHVWSGAAGEYQAALLCDNTAELFLNGKRVAAWASYREPWLGALRLSPGDVLAVSGSDAAGESGNRTAGLFFALAQDGRTLLSAEDFRVRPGPADPAWLASADVKGLEAPDPANVHEAHRGAPPAPKAGAAQAIRAQLDPPDFSGPEGAKALHRRIGASDVYFIMDLARRAACTFRARGAPELWDAWTGGQTPLDTFAANPDGTTTVTLDGEPGVPLLVVFTPPNGRDAPPKRPPAQRAEEEQTPRGGGLAELPLDGEWGFALKPTCYNKWGDFRQPGFDGFIGAEARHVTWSADNMPARMTYSHGPQFRAFGPLAPGAEADALERVLAKAGALASDKSVSVNGKPYAWQPFCFSWREGVENRPGYQNWHHGLNGKVGDEFFVLGRYDRGLYDVSMPPEAAPEARLYHTAVYAAEACRAVIVSTGVKPSAVWLAGERRSPGDTVALKAGHTPLLVRYDAFGRAALVLRRADAPPFAQTHPLAMRWYQDPAVLPFDCFGGALPQATYSFGAPPALNVAEVTVRGELLSATVGGAAAEVKLDKALANGNRLYRVEDRGRRAEDGAARRAAMEVTLTVKHAPGFTGGAAFPEPVKLTCGQGAATLGDWARVDALRCYSGGAVYTKAFALTREQTARRCLLDLGGVGVSCGVAVNGQPERVLTCPPWRLDVSGAVKVGANTLTVTVYNTLNNHYQTLPTRYRKPVEEAPSGLLGPVTLRFEAKGMLR